MATTPQSFPSQTLLMQAMPKRVIYQAWLLVFCGITVLCVESTPMMGGGTAGRWLTDVWPRILGQANTPFFGEVHHVLRKFGHFMAYGTLGLFLRKAWHYSVRVYTGMTGRQLMLAASALSVSFTFLAGCLDEWHQRSLPGRTSTGLDVVIDTCGALLFNAIFWLTWARRRKGLVGVQA